MNQQKVQVQEQQRTQCCYSQIFKQYYTQYKSQFKSMVSTLPQDKNDKHSFSKRQFLLKLLEEYYQDKSSFFIPYKYNLHPQLSYDNSDNGFSNIFQYGSIPMQFDPIIQYNEEVLINMSFYIHKLFIGIKDAMLEPIWGQITFYQRSSEQDLERITDNFYFTYIEDKIKQIFFPEIEVDNEFKCFQVSLPTDINKTVYMVITLFKLVSTDVKNQYELYSDLNTNFAQPTESENQYYAKYFNEMHIHTSKTYTGKACKQSALFYQTTIHNTLTKIGPVKQPFLVGMFQVVKQEVTSNTFKFKMSLARGKEQRDAKVTLDKKPAVDDGTSEELDPILQQKSEIEIFRNSQLKRLTEGQSDTSTSFKAPKTIPEQNAVKRIFTPFDTFVLDNIVWVQYFQTPQAKSWDENIKNIFMQLLRRKIGVVTYVNMQIHMNYMNIGQQKDKTFIFKHNCHYKSYFTAEAKELLFTDQIKTCKTIQKYLNEGSNNKLKEQPIVHVYNSLINHMLQNVVSDDQKVMDKKLKYQILSMQKICTTQECLQTQSALKVYQMECDLIMFNMNTQLSNNLVIRLNQLTNLKPNKTYKIVVKVINKVTKLSRRLIYSWRRGIVDIQQIRLMRSYKSSIQYHQTSPIFSDEIRIKISTYDLDQHIVVFSIYSVILSSISQNDEPGISKKTSDTYYSKNNLKSPSFSAHSLISPKSNYSVETSRASNVSETFDRQYERFYELYGEFEDDYDNFENLQSQYYTLMYKGQMELSDILQEKQQIFDKKILLQYIPKSDDSMEKKDVTNPELSITCKLNSIFYVNQPEIKQFYDLIFSIQKLQKQLKGKQLNSRTQSILNNFKQLLIKFDPSNLVTSQIYDDFKTVKTRLNVRDDVYQYVKLCIQQMPLLITLSVHALENMSFLQDNDKIKVQMFIVNFLANIQFIIKNLIKFHQSPKKPPKIYFKHNIVQMVLQNNALINEDLIYHAIFNKNIETFDQLFNLQLTKQYVDGIEKFIQKYKDNLYDDNQLQDVSVKSQTKQMQTQNVCSFELQCCYDTSIYAEHIQKDQFYNYQQTQFLHICKEFVSLKTQFFTMEPILQKMYSNITILNQKILDNKNSSNKVEQNKRISNEILILHYKIQVIVSFMTQLTYNQIQGKVNQYQSIVKQIFDIINYLKTLRIPNPSIVPSCTQNIQFITTVITDVISQLLYQQSQEETNKKQNNSQEQQQQSEKINIITLIPLVDQQYSQNKDLWEYPVQFQVFVYLTWNIIILQNTDILKQVFQQLLFILQTENLRLKAIQVISQFLQLFIMYMEKNLNANIKISQEIRLQFAQQLINQLISVITKDWTQQDQYNSSKQNNALQLLKIISEALHFSGNQKKCFQSCFYHENQLLVLQHIIESVYNSLDIQRSTLNIDNLRNENLYNYYNFFDKLLCLFEPKIKLMGPYNSSCSQNFGVQLQEQQKEITQQQLLQLVGLILNQKEQHLQNILSFFMNLVEFIPLAQSINLLHLILSNILQPQDENNKIELSIDEKTLICKAIFDISQFYEKIDPIIGPTEEQQKLQWNMLNQNILYILISFKDLDLIISSQLSNIQQWFYQQKNDVIGVIEKVLKDVLDQSGSKDTKIQIIRQRIEYELQIINYSKSNRNYFIEIINNILINQKIDSQQERNETIKIVSDMLLVEIKQKFINRLDFMRQFITYCYNINEEDKNKLQKHLIMQASQNIPTQTQNIDKQFYDQSVIQDLTNLSMQSTDYSHQINNNDGFNDKSILDFRNLSEYQDVNDNSFLKDFFKRIKKCSQVLDNQEKLFNISGKNINSLVLARQIEIMYDEFKMDLEYNQKLLKLNNIIQLTEQNKMYIESAFQYIEKALLLNKQLTGNKQHWKLYDDLFPLTLGIYESKYYYLQSSIKQGTKKIENNLEIVESILQCISTASKYFKYYHIQQIDFHLTNVMRQLIRYMQMEDKQSLQQYYIPLNTQKNKQQNEAEVDLRIGFYYKVTRHKIKSHKQQTDEELKSYIYRQPTWQVLAKFQNEIQQYYEKSNQTQYSQALPNKSDSLMISDPEEQSNKSDIERDAEISIISILEYQAKPEKYQNNNVITIQTLSQYQFNSSEESLLDSGLQMSNYIVQKIQKMMYEGLKTQNISSAQYRQDNYQSQQKSLNNTTDTRDNQAIDNFDNYVVEAKQYVKDINLVLVAQLNVSEHLESDRSQKLYGQELEFNLYKQSFPGCNIRQEIQEIVTLKYTPILKQVVDLHQKVCELNSRSDVAFVVDQLWSICVTTVREGLVQGTALLLQYYNEKAQKELQVAEEEASEVDGSARTSMNIQWPETCEECSSDAGRLKHDVDGKLFYDYELDEQLELYIEQLHLILFQAAMKLNELNQRQNEQEVRAVAQKIQTIRQMFGKIVADLQSQCGTVCGWFAGMDTLLVPEQVNTQNPKLTAKS